MPTPFSKKTMVSNTGQSFLGTIPPWAWGLMVLLALFVVLVSLFWSPSRASGSLFFFEPIVQIVPLRGSISSETGSFSDEFSSTELVAILQAADRDPTVGAVLLDIESPGGNIVATKQIVAQLRAMKKPVVSWIGDVGASGAYYSAAATDWIMADRDSITGSIGVISMYPNIEELLDNWGIQMRVLKEGEFKTIGSPFEEMTPEEKRLLQTMLHDAFLHFKEDVRSFRDEKLDAELFEQVTDGRVLSGSQALDAGLIDAVGTRQDAIQKAADLAGIQGTPQTETTTRPAPTLADFFFRSGQSFGDGFQTSFTALANPNVTGIQAR